MCGNNNVNLNLEAGQGKNPVAECINCENYNSFDFERDYGHPCSGCHFALFGFPSQNDVVVFRWFDKIFDYREFRKAYIDNEMYEEFKDMLHYPHSFTEYRDLLDENAEDEEEETETSNKATFSPDASQHGKEMELTEKIIIEDITTQQLKDPITSGLIYTHFFPHGVAEKTVRHLSERHNADNVMTIIVRPFSGRIKVFEEFIESEEIFGRD